MKTQENQTTNEKPEIVLDLIVGGTAPVITSNFEELKLAIFNRLKDYKIQVTEENLAQAKKDATELGKAATQLNKLKTEKAKEFSEPVEKFKAQIMELVGMIQDGQEHIKNQIKKFEDKTREACKLLMVSTLKAEWEKLGVRPEFHMGAAEIDKMVGISKVSKSGELTKAARELIEALATSDRGTQDRYDSRIARLEADCYKAGLKTPLTKNHVESWLYKTDDEYQKNLEYLIKIEVERQEKTLKAEQDRMEKEARLKAEAEAREKMRIEREAREKIELESRQTQQIEPSFKAPPPIQPKQPGKITIVVKFSVETTKTSSEDLEKTKQWFDAKVKSLGIPLSYQISIEN